MSPDAQTLVLGAPSAPITDLPAALLIIDHLYAISHVKYKDAWNPNTVVSDVLFSHAPAAVSNPRRSVLSTIPAFRTPVVIFTDDPECYYLSYLSMQLEWSRDPLLGVFVITKCPDSFGGSEGAENSRTMDNKTDAYPKQSGQILQWP